jgi:hypothetical protein
MMKSTVEYYLGNLGVNNNSSQQGRDLRKIVLSDKSEVEIVFDFESFVLSQNQLSSDTISIINKALLCGYGSEYHGLGGDDNYLKGQLFLKFLNHFPQIPSFRFNYADCCMMNNQPVEDYFAILKEGIIQDTEYECFVTSELSCAIHESQFSFEFDMLFFEKEFKSFDKESFFEYLYELKDTYRSEAQQKYLDATEKNFKIQ